MSQFEYQTSKHTIDGADFTISKLAPTSGEPYTRSLIVTTVADTVQVEFTAEGFELLKAVLREY